MAVSGDGPKGIIAEKRPLRKSGIGSVRLFFYFAKVSNFFGFTKFVYLCCRKIARLCYRELKIKNNDN